MAILIKSSRLYLFTHVFLMVFWLLSLHGNDYPEGNEQIVFTNTNC